MFIDRACWTFIISLLLPFEARRKVCGVQNCDTDLSAIHFSAIKLQDRSAQTICSFTYCIFLKCVCTTLHACD
jgi:hypothetical protein